MKDNRRSFIKKGASLAATLSLGGANSAFSYSQNEAEQKAYKEVVRDAGMQMCEAYFSGMDERKIALTKQMDVLGAVGGVNTRILGPAGTNAIAWEYETIVAVKEAWEKVGLKLRVIE